MAVPILSANQKADPVSFGLLSGVALSNPSAQDCADIINTKADQALAVIQAARTLLRANPEYLVDGLLDTVEFALAAILDVSFVLIKA